MSDRPRLSRAGELVGTLAVVLSLVYVGMQVRQNTAAIHSASSHAVYQLNQDMKLVLMESAEMADIIARAEENLGDLSPADSIRYRSYLNGRINLHEAVYTTTIQGAMEPDLAAGWLASLPTLPCVAGIPEYWIQNGPQYHEAFREAMDSAFALADCTD